MQENHYYPFGLNMVGYWYPTVNPQNDFQYNGIEFEESINLNFAFYRTLDPTIGRWLQVDPYAESFYSMSPYNSMGNNPILYSDPNGDFIHILIGAGVGAVINIGVQAFQGNINSLGDLGMATLIGGGAGALGAAAGGAAFAAAGSAGIISGTGGVLGGAIAGASGGAVGGFVQGTGNALYFGDKNIGEALGQGLKEGAIGLAVGGVTGGIAGGIRTGLT